MKIEWNRVTWYSTLVAVVVFLATFGIAFYIGVTYEQVHLQSPITVIPGTGGGRACTMEAKLCPDGSYVGRTGPNCEFTACPTTTATTTGSGVPTSGSGVRGNVSLGPTCPVERIPPDPACADKPYATAILVYRSGSSIPAAIGNSNTDGIFTFSLPAGSYTLSATGNTTLPRCASVNVKVIANTYATTTIFCDTGIR